ncbi:hypothetical protein [Roseofilum casamattae]|uniref:Uncharacterized protein n=1 Tax=Roseofilum casamattae BLCC-M143 TaxID=3022442 RepID=A0ABT7BR31_9CYAN|nr:hypothetical protein [Roseofilum casamattae]MDJ1181645.1 hypothetical protein [Roseofilum casamattae BLCC-M143]
MKISFIILLGLFLPIATSARSNTIPVNPPPLSGNLQLELKYGVWKLWDEEQAIYQNITLDLTCDRGKCEPEVWGYAPKFDKHLDHYGTLERISRDSGWELHVNLAVQSEPWKEDIHTGEYVWQPDINTATYIIQLQLDDGKLIGTYTGIFKDKQLSGSVEGKLTPQKRITLPDRAPISAREHPRIAFNKNQLSQLQKKARTPYGRAILTRLQTVLKGKIDYDGYNPNSGYHAAGHCFLFGLNQDRKHAMQGWELARNTLNEPPPRLLERSDAAIGIALAYDLCYSAWTEAERREVTSWLAIQAMELARGDAPGTGWNGNAPSNWNARARSAAIVASLAVWQEPNAFFPQNSLVRDSEELRYWQTIAERNIQRYFQSALGDRGFGTEGDLYTRESLHHILPMLQAYQNVLGQAWVTDGKAEWILPHYLMRMVDLGEGVTVPSYGRHRKGPDGSLFALGLPTASERFLPALLWFFNRHWGLEGDRTFGIGETTPHDAIFALVGYPEHVEAENPGEHLGRVLVDRQKQFYMFRDRWQDSRDFITSIYLKGEPINKGAWSFNDAGSFRIWGLGERWAIAGPSQSRRRHENVVLVPNIRGNHGSEASFFESYPSGSGIVSLKHKNWLRSFAVDYTKISGSPGLFAVVDRFERSSLKKTWVMHTPGKVMLEKQRFRIESDSGATLQGIFIMPESVKLTYEATETGGKIQATGDNEFFVVMTVQDGEEPPIQVEGEGLGSVVRVGDQTIQFLGDRLQLGNVR